MKKQAMQNILESIKTIGQRMQILSYQTVDPPYLLNTLCEYRRIYLKKYIKRIDLQTIDESYLQQVLGRLKIIAKQLDSQVRQKYEQQLISAYVKKIKTGSKNLKTFRIGSQEDRKALRKQVDGTLFCLVQWLLQIQLTQDLLFRLQLYLQIQIPDQILNFNKSYDSKSSQGWGYYLVAKIKKFISTTLKAGSKLVQSSFFTGIVSGALVLTIMVLQNSYIPLQMKVNPACFIPVSLVAIIPSIFQSLATQIDKTQSQKNIKKWQQTFRQLTESIKKFNRYLQTAIQKCINAENSQNFLKQRTNLQKIILSLVENQKLVTEFDQQKLEETKLRTQAYYKQYFQIRQGDWTLVSSNDLSTVKQNKQNTEQIYQYLQIEKASSHHEDEKNENSSEIELGCKKQDVSSGKIDQR